MYFDGSVMKTGVGLLFVSPLGEHMWYLVRLHFPVSNIMAEYEALLGGLRIATELGIKHLDIRGDSQLIIGQVMKNASCLDEKMEAYCTEVHKLEDKFLRIELNHMARRYNEEADELTKIASGKIIVPPNIFARDLAKLSVNFDKLAAASGNASGADPSRHIGTDPNDEDPMNGELEASGLEGSQADCDAPGF
jgi:ribonuclease HI